MPKFYPTVLKDQPGLNRDVKIVDHMATVLKEGDFISIITNPSSGTANIYGLVPYDSVFKPSVDVPKVLTDPALERCLTHREVITECLADNWRHTAQQQAKLPDLILASLERWDELNQEEQDTVEEV